MTKTESQKKSHTGNCLFCIHGRFCLVNWGTDCKRQGGKKIPRLKSAFGKDKVDKQEVKKTNISRKFIKQKKVFSEPIRTKTANW